MDNNNKMLEGKILTCMYDYVHDMEDKLKRIHALSAELGFGRMVASMGRKSCDLLHYFIDKDASNPDCKLEYINFERKISFPVSYMPRINELDGLSVPFCKCVNEEGFLRDPKSKDIVAKPELQWIAFQLYETTYRQKLNGSMVVLRGWEDRNIGEVLEVDDYFKPDIPKFERY